MFPKQICQWFLGESRCPKLAWVDNLDARVISRFPLSPSNGVTSTKNSGTFLKTVQSCKPISNESFYRYMELNADQVIDSLGIFPKVNCGEIIDFILRWIIYLFLCMYVTFSLAWRLTKHDGILKRGSSSITFAV